MSASKRGVRGSAPLAVALSIACAGCAAQRVVNVPAPEPAGRTAPQTSGPDSHSIRADELHATMQELDRVRGWRLPQELDEGRATALQSQEVARIARALADTAAEIEPAAPLATLDESDRDEFHRLASALRERAAALAADAPALSTAELGARLAEIDASCDACHRRYRDPLEAPPR